MNIDYVELGCDDGEVQECEIEFEISEEIKNPVYVYYELEDF